MGVVTFRRPVVRHQRTDPYPPPHSTPGECDRWMPGFTQGCPHISDAQHAALVACGQWPTTAPPLGWVR